MAAGTWRSELRRVGLAIRKQCVGPGLVQRGGGTSERRLTAAVTVSQQRQKRSPSFFFVVQRISGASVYFNEEQSLQAY